MIADFNYRDRFKLTQKELIDEPYDVYIINKKIMNTFAEKEALEMKPKKHR